MAIPETQLDTWSKQGAVVTSRDTYKSIKTVIESNSSPFAARSCSSFLQGSYCNDTNVYADSDVDIVLKTDAMFYYNLDQLPDAQKTSFNSAYSGTASYQHGDFKSDVLAWLTEKYGSDVKLGTKAIFVKGSGNRRNADVLPAATFRKYLSFVIGSNPTFVEGVCFFAGATRIEIFPKQHSDNCTAKHQATKQWFKPTVRIFKNMRNRMIDDRVIEQGLAPSYFIEGMLYNVPSDQFGSSYEDTVVNCINWLVETDRSKCLCANEQFYLLHASSPVT